MRQYHKNFKMRIAMIAMVIATFVGVSFYSAYTDTSLCEIILGVSALNLATVPVLVNIDRVGDRETAGKQIHYRLYYLHVNQVDRESTWPSVTSGTRNLGNIPLITGQYWHYFDVIDYSPEDKSTSSKGDVTSTVENTLSFIVGGMRDAVLDFIESNQGEAFYLVIQEVDTGKKYFYGRELQPFILSTFDRLNNKEGRYTTLTFTSPSFDQPLTYTGNTLTEADDDDDEE